MGRLATGPAGGATRISPGGVEGKRGVAGAHGAKAGGMTRTVVLRSAIWRVIVCTCCIIASSCPCWSSRMAPCSSIWVRTYCDAQERNQMQTRVNAEIVVYSGKGHSQVVRDSKYKNDKKKKRMVKNRVQV